MAKARRRPVKNPAIPRLTWVAKNYPIGVLYYTIAAWFTAAGLDDAAITLAGILYDIQDPDIHHEWLPGNLESDPEEVKEYFLNYAAEQIVYHDEESTEYDKYLPWLAKSFHAISKKPLKRANKAIKAYYHDRGETTPDIYPIDLLDAQYASDASAEEWTEMMMVTELIDVLLEVETSLSKTWSLRHRFGTIVAWAEGAGVNLDGYAGFDAEIRAVEWARTRPKHANIVPGEVVYEFGDGWTFQELKTKKQLKCEGTVLIHCVKSYKAALIGKEYRIFSLRDPDGQPVATMQWSVPDEYVVQYYGLSNKIPEKDEVERGVQFRLNYIDENLVSSERKLERVDQHSDMLPPYVGEFQGRFTGVYMLPGDPNSAVAVFDSGYGVPVRHIRRLVDKLEREASDTYGPDDRAGQAEGEVLERVRAMHIRDIPGGAYPQDEEGAADSSYAWELWKKSPVIIASHDGLLDHVGYYDFSPRQFIADNPRKPKAAKQQKRLYEDLMLQKGHRLWETYDAKPLKKHLVAFGKHIEKMKASSSPKVKTEARRAARAFNAELKERGWKR